MLLLEILKTILLGIVEGITEWLPISSTGHMILLDEFIRLDLTDAFKEMFFVVIQLGAIGAVVVLFFDRLNPFSKKKSESERKTIYSLWGKIIVGAIPAGVIGVFLDDFLDENLYRFEVVAIALVVYAIAFILVEALRKKEFRVDNPEDLSYKDAFLIGVFQVLSLIPGTSRSGSTMLGGVAIGVSRKASSEFSFFMAIPVMLGASGLKILKFALDYAGSPDKSAYIPEGALMSYLLIFTVGLVVSFVVSLFVIKFLIDFVKRHTLIPFAIYRIILGVVVITYFLCI